ncbi:MAG: aldo/keto reductase [Desulfobacterales bacterium]
MIQGHATGESTWNWAHRYPTMAHTALGRSGLTCSRVGFGGYRIDTQTAIHREALRLALGSGINLIDTSANYADGRSEKLVGQVLAELIDEGALVRETVIVVTKAGYLQGQNYELSRNRKQEGRPFPDLIPYAEGLEHCIHPEFLEDQITRSLERLNLACIDVLLLHNPEYFLSWAAKEGTALETARQIYCKRIQLAFGHLEKEVARGRIRCYGISSNTFPDAPGQADFTSLTEVQACAEALKPDHHLAVIQFPMNLFENGAMLEANQPDGRTLLAAARRLGLGTLVNRPLNALTANGLIRLADVPAGPALPPEEVADRLQDLVTSEARFVREILPNLGLAPETASQISRQLTMAEALRTHHDAYSSYDHWRQIESEHILPRAGGVLAYLQQNAGNPTTRGWMSDYGTCLKRALEAVRSCYAPAAAQRATALKAAIRKADTDWDTDNTLSQLAIRTLVSTPGISAVLVGMRQPAYVRDVLAALQPIPEDRERTASWAKLKADLPA